MATIPWDRYEEPLCWLPDVVRYCQRGWGNPLLDTGLDMIDGPDLTRWLWDKDINAVKELYAEAHPIWKRIAAFLKWCDDEDTLRTVVEILLGLETLPLIRILQ